MTKLDKQVTPRLLTTNLVAELQDAGARWDGKRWRFVGIGLDGYLSFGRHGTAPFAVTWDGEERGEFPLGRGARSSVVEIVRWWIDKQRQAIRLGVAKR